MGVIRQSLLLILALLCMCQLSLAQSYGPTGSPAIEIHVTASNNDGSAQSVGISDGASGNDDLTSFGPSASDFTGARSFTFDQGGVPTEATISPSLTSLSSPTYVPLSDD